MLLSLFAFFYEHSTLQKLISIFSFVFERNACCCFRFFCFLLVFLFIHCVLLGVMHVSFVQPYYI